MEMWRRVEEPGKDPRCSTRTMRSLVSWYSRHFQLHGHIQGPPISLTPSFFTAESHCWIIAEGRESERVKRQQFDSQGHRLKKHFPKYNCVCACHPMPTTAWTHNMSPINPQRFHNSTPVLDWGPRKKWRDSQGRGRWGSGVTSPSHQKLGATSKRALLCHLT